MFMRACRVFTVFLTQKTIDVNFQFIENQWFVIYNIALACYPLALQTLSASLLSFVNSNQMILNLFEDKTSFVKFEESIFLDRN